jgi:YggT family protein
MFVLANFVGALAGVLNYFLGIYMVIVIVAALITWVNPDPYNPIVRFLYGVTDPLFAYVRRVLPLPTMGIDISPIIVILIILFLQSFIVPTLLQLALKLK